MLKFDHLRIPVTNLTRSRDWYVGTLGMKIEFEIPERRAVAVQDGEGFTIFLEEAWSARGVEFAHGPIKSYWGYGAELADPDGYLIRLWDERSMKER